MEPPGKPPAPHHETAAASLSALVSLVLRLWPRELSLSTEAVVAELSRRGPRRLSELATVTGVTQPTMTELVSRLCAGGLAQRRPDPADRRAVLVALTVEGEAGFARRREVTGRLLAGLIARLPAAQADALTAALPAIDAVTALVPELDRAR